MNIDTRKMNSYKIDEKLNTVCIDDYTCNYKKNGFLISLYRKLKKLLVMLRTYGNKYRCPCCGNTFRKMLSFKYYSKIYNRAIYRGLYRNIECPYCYSLPRHRIICEYLEKQIDNIRGRKILMFASERGILNWLGDRRISCVTADLYAPADLKIDITDIELEDESIDLIFCNHVLEHVIDYQKALREIHRILTKEGKLICSVPIDTDSETTVEDFNLKTEEERKKAYGQGDHFRNFGLNFPIILENHHFKVQILDGATYPEEIIPRIGPGKYDYNKIFICTKQ